MVASSLWGEFVSYRSVLLWQPCRANFCPSACQFLSFCRSSRDSHSASPGIQGAKHLECRG
jgi:hypothetical protein